ncbi:MAG: magnesium transporter CorA family protein [Dehalococcoidales bacterium]|nr:magnesium transporter CorA family protein [Dehalococcoidales bacterium]
MKRAVQVNTLERLVMAKLLGWHHGADRKKEIQEPRTQEEGPLNIETITYGGLTWVNIEPPTKREIAWLAEKFHFHPLALDDCISRKQISKIDVYPGYVFFVFHYPYYDKATRIASKKQWAAFIGEDFLVTLHTGDLKTLKALFRDCQENEEARREFFSGGSGYLLYRILDRAIDSYFPVLDKILSLLEDLEDAVFDEDIEAAKEIAILRRDIITQRAVMFPTRAIFVEMENKLKRFSKIDLTAQYNDLMDHMNRICQALDECQEIIEVFKDTDYVLATNRVNRVLRILNIFATIALPFLIVSSIYGMNIYLPGGIEKGKLDSFVVLMLIMAVIAGAMLIFFRRRRWI